MSAVLQQRVGAFVGSNYKCLEWRHASAILERDFPAQWQDLLACLQDFRLLKSSIVVGGGAKSPVAAALDGFLYARGWVEKSFDTATIIDGARRDTPTHSIDCFKNRVAVEVEWNNKDPFFDRDLNNFRLLFERDAISVGVIVTRDTELQGIFREIGRASSFGNSTTHLSKLVPRIEGGGAGGCPVLVFGIGKSLYVEDV